jgi:hypothetical protein
MLTRHLAAAGAAIAVLALTACASTAGPLTVDDVVPKLEAAGIDCTETSSEPIQDAVQATAVTCVLGDSGGIVVIVAESAEEIDKARTQLCSEVDPAQGNLDLASGEHWLSVTLSTVGVGAPQVAEALGGTATKVKDYCA